MGLFNRLVMRALCGISSDVLLAEYRNNRIFYNGFFGFFGASAALFESRGIISQHTLVHNAAELNDVKLPSSNSTHWRLLYRDKTVVELRAEAKRRGAHFLACVLHPTEECHQHGSIYLALRYTL